MVLIFYFFNKVFPPTSYMKTLCHCAYLTLLDIYINYKKPDFFNQKFEYLLEILERFAKNIGTTVHQTGHGNILNIY